MLNPCSLSSSLTFFLLTFPFILISLKQIFQKKQEEEL